MKFRGEVGVKWQLLTKREGKMKAL